MVKPEVMMKNWLSIGQFAKKSGLSPRSLRIYEKQKLLISSTRGENNYRYFCESQLNVALRIKEFKSLGFTLREINSLLKIDPTIATDKLLDFINRRLEANRELGIKIKEQENQLVKIITSLKNNKKCLTKQERNFVMNQLSKISIVVTGVQNLELTAKYIQQHLVSAGIPIKVFTWKESLVVPMGIPHLIIIPEKALNTDSFSLLKPDVVVIKNLSHFDHEIEHNYLKLYSNVGPHMKTIFNADDRISVQLAHNEIIRKGRTFYFSKNAGLQTQIERIGGIVSDGEEVNILRENLQESNVKIKMYKFLGYEEEISYLASLAALMDIGLTQSHLMAFNV